MNSILEDLFMGRIDIMESLYTGKQKPIPDREAFIKTLSPEQQELYEKILDAFMEQWAVDNQTCFINGFKMAARIILECLSETDGNKD